MAAPEYAAAGPPVFDWPRDHRLAAEHRLVQRYLDEAPVARLHEVHEVPAGGEILAAGRERQARAVLAAVERLTWVRGAWRAADLTAAPSVSPLLAFGPLFREAKLLDDLASALLRRALPFEQDDLAAGLESLADSLERARGRAWSPLPRLLTAALAAPEPGPRLTSVLRRVEAAMEHGPDAGAEERRLTGRIRAALSAEESGVALDPCEPWAVLAAADLAAHGADRRAAWNRLMSHAASAEQSKPGRRWSERARALLGEVGEEEFRETVARWFPEVGQQPVATLVEPNATVLRGLAWCCPLLEDDSTAPAVGRLAAACFKKIPDIGARSVKTGNACLLVLAELPGAAGPAHLVQLRGSVKLPSVQKRIAAALAAAADAAGVTPEELEELAVPAFGAVADSLLSGQRARLERLLLRPRGWDLGTWTERYLDHPLVGTLARRLVWRVEHEGAGRLAIWWDGRLVDRHDRPVDPPPAARVSLWHPIADGVETVQAWRLWLEEHEVRQPFKQAHREVYRLTDAERATRIYSNRFAGHVLRQHQLAALLRARGWTYALQGAWDSENAPTLDLPEWDLRAELLLPVPREETGDGAFRHVGTDQVRFRDPADEPVALWDVPPLVLTEVMRDVDLFVAVCSVGNDPSWQDGGERPAAYAAYWRDYAFGDLSTSAQARRELVKRLLPKLRIAAQSRVEGRFLVVDGELNSYRIHLGSANVLMEPGSRYLCLVRDGAAGDGHGDAPLPFEGDSILSLVLSKAFLLADDRRIRDPAIVSQLRLP